MQKVLTANMLKTFLTSESVTEGHPDKLADQISDSILDAMLAQDSHSRVAVETLVANGYVVVAGEVTTEAYVDIPATVRGVIKHIGYTNSAYGLDADTCGVMVSIHEQSSDIARGVGKKRERPEDVGAGDQGMMFGYATDETPELMPAPIAYAHRITRELASARKKGTVPYLRPDGKSQVTVEYKDGIPFRIDTVLVSTQHDAKVSSAKIKNDMVRLIKKVLPAKLIDSKTKYYVNPTGRFVIGGPAADTGLTGRKIIVDTYGGASIHGGGAFSGKDPTKVDRSGAYYARYAAKNIVASGAAGRAEVKVAYAIGMANPLMVDVDTFGTSGVPHEKLCQVIKKVFDFRPGMIIKQLNLQRPIYNQVASYGHFGRPDLNLPWERTDRASKIAKSLKMIGVKTS